MSNWLKQEAAMLWWAAAMLLVSAIYLTINMTQTHYSGTGYQLASMARYIPWGLSIIGIAVYLKKISPRFSFVFESLAKLYWIYFLSAISCYAIQFTPFPLIDTHLLAFDRSLGFSSGAVFLYTQHHHWALVFSNFVYKNLDIELLVLPFLMAFLLEKRSVRIFFLANVITTFIIYNLYYFFPSTEPARVIPNVNFLQHQYDVIAQWYQIHHYLADNIHVGDLIGFPSFHVAWAVLLTYLCRNRKWLFYPVLVFNVLVMVSTMTLGWHYLADVLAGLVVAVGSIYLAEVGIPKEKVVKSIDLISPR